MSKISKLPTVRMPSAEEDKAITAAARSDPDAQPLTPKQLKSMLPIKALRGRPKSEHKKLLVSVRYSQEVVEFFKATGMAGNREWMAFFVSTWRAIPVHEDGVDPIISLDLRSPRL